MDRRLFLSTLGLAGCTGSPPLTVGAKNFLEQDILGEILSQHLTRRLGITPRQRLHLGGSFLAHQALIDGSIDLYPEYSGTALTACLKLPLVKDPAVVQALVRDEYRRRHGIHFGWPLGFANTFAFTMRRAEATRRQLATLSDAVREARPWRIGVGYEFEQRPDGWRSFSQNYPLKLDGALRTMDLGLLYRALDAGEVDLVAGNSTDAALATGNFTVLADDQHFFPPYDTCLAVRGEALRAFPALRGALDALTGKIPVERMRGWLAAAVNERQSPTALATVFVATL